MNDCSNGDPAVDGPAERILDEGRDVAYQRREWAVQRVGWALMALVILAAVAGLLGSAGPLAEGRASAADGSIRVTYARLDRHHAPSQLRVEVAPAFVEDGEVRLWLDSAYAEAIGLQSVVPEPERVELEPDRLVYVFAAGAAVGPLTVTFSYEHDGFWWQRGRVGLVTGTPVAFSQFVYP